MYIFRNFFAKLEHLYKPFKMRLLYNQLSKEQKFLLNILKSYKFAVFLFLGGSLLVALFDGISIGLLIPALGFLQGGAETGELPKALQWLTDLIIAFPPEKQLLLSVGFVVLAVLVKNLLLGVTFKQGVWISNRVTADVRLKAVTTLLTVGMDFHHKSKSGELIEKTINYTQWVREVIVNSVQFCVFLFMLLVLLIMLVALSWQLTAMAVILCFVCVGLMSTYVKRLTILAEKSAKTSRELTGAVQENLGAVKLIQSYGREQHQITELNYNIQAHFYAENKLTFRRFSIQPLTEGLGVLSIGVLLVVSFYYFPLNSPLQLTILIPYLFVLIRVVTTLKILNDSRCAIRSCWPYLRLVNELIQKDNKPFIADGFNKFRGLKHNIRFQSVTFSYNRDRKYVLKDVNISIPKGKTTAIVGKSGVGKSTIVNLLLRFYDPQQGCILIDGQPLKGFQLASYRRHIGIVCQDIFIFNDTVKYNIAFGMDEAVSDDQIIETAKKTGAHEFICNLPDGYYTVLGDRGVKLSGGQRQRISIARAILKDPEILILDEATSSLDTITEGLIHNTITELSRNRTVIIIAHRLSTIRNADQVIVLKNGCVVESGDPQQLLSQKTEYHRLVKAQ